MRGLADYGRYDDDPKHVGCPRAKSDMTPCIARDGKLALADDGECVACRAKPGVLLAELREVYPPVGAIPTARTVAADHLKAMVRAATEPV